MPLQVDAVFPYLTRREKVFLADLKIDSPYNTYLHKGLPPGPIANPGLNAIDAALHPKKSPYLYYLHDKNGRIHFAKTYMEHLKNKEKYLKPKSALKEGFSLLSFYLIIAIAAYFL